ncbi:bactofilin family protein [Bittarella massiliensis (ex Durand et al. 2017)]|uniref:bactofilin family protein n=1 Tax=Bittarella massiliensis (ex Durand et al. 2017) TaxID=1720313 RepID=UPI001AA1164A|nr:polymer-forming cytoskeletal protein [Bittarella massiliensis (ex Durand et al. 2017)]MBO1678620.1 polymer-forming cytoskeletal protein [Bittarella massiliensis (ex Durand et al. 2017)]
MAVDHKGGGSTPGEQLGRSGLVGTGEGSVLVADVLIEGTVHTSSPVRLMGCIKGDLLTESQVVIGGSVEGNVSGREVLLAGASIRGDVRTAGMIRMDRETEVTGDLSAQRIEMSGSVEGSLLVEKTLLMGRTASVQGDISAGAVSIAEGAALKGRLEVRGLADEPAPSQQTEIVGSEELPEEAAPGTDGRGE